MDVARHSVDRHRAAVETGRSETEEFAAVQARLAGATDAATASLEAQRTELKKAADPVFALAAAKVEAEKAEQRVVELAAEGKEGTEEYAAALFDFVSATTDASIAQGALSDTMTADGGAVSAFREAAEAAGLTKDQIDRLIGSLETLTASPWHVRVSGGVGAGFTTAGGLRGFQHGGVVPGRIGEPQLAVVHGGEEITNPHDPSAPGRPTAVLYFTGNTFGATQEAVQGGVAEALIAAGIAEDVIFDGAGL
jgi:hypothetical protein